ncbi:CRISPR-associated helicase Cas3' [Streptomyces sp. NPDC021020]|uniref:CRISPR-associated helicase Cas3' n=1 Tax=Streptomyces sp. NPDC021020 TaxID=3365109 RepID=UPI0037B205B3
MWGKAGVGGRPHPLICHALDTAAVTEVLFDVAPGPHCREELLAALGPLGDGRGWAAVLCGLHDLGKCSPTFQALRSDLARDLLPREVAADVLWQAENRGPGKRADIHHGILTALHLKRILRGWGASLQTAKSIAWALGGHHGVVPLSASVQQARYAIGGRGGRWWDAAVESLVAHVADLWGLPDPKGLPWGEVRLSPQAVVTLAGLASVSDWIASARPQEDYAGSGVDLSGYVAQARRVEFAKVSALRWSPWTAPGNTEFASLFRTVRRPFPVQLLVERAVAGMQGPGIVVVAAPTGEGKTKAALQAAATFVRVLGLRGFYVAMPSRLTSNQVYDITEEFLSDNGGGAALRLLHAAAQEYLKGRSEDAPLVPRDVDADGQGDGEGLAGEWFAGKKGLLAPLGVGTVDQVLMAGLRSTHVFVRLLGLSGKAVVLDEVHGYDVHMSALLDRVVWWLGLMRVPVVLLSATLPWKRQQELVASWQAGALGDVGQPGLPAVVGSAAYPRVVWADSSGTPARVAAVDASELNQDRAVRIVRVPFQGHAVWALEQAREGQCVAVVHNLVRCAVDAYLELAEAVAELPEDERPELVLLHGRLTAAERTAAEAVVRAKFGQRGESGEDSRPKRAIVVGTQLLEQGIDVDFDVMVSALAPVDSLIQRMGRIQRHSRRRPLVLALTGVEDAGRKVVFPPYTTSVYDELVLLRTWAVLRDRERVNCPGDVQELVDSVYGDAQVPCPPEWRSQWGRAAAVHDRRRRRHESEAVWLRLPQPRRDLQVEELTQRPGSARRTRIQSGKPVQ